MISQYAVYEPLNDRLGAAICTGTGFVARRKALEDIGGWPLIVPCDDIMCSTLLNKHGWKVAYVQESVQVGLGPDSWEAFLKQKMRWVSPSRCVKPHAAAAAAAHLKAIY